MSDLFNDFITGFGTIAPLLGMTLIHSLWQGAAVAIILATVLRIMAAASATARYAVSCCALLIFLLIAAATFTAMTPIQSPAPPASVVSIGMPALMRFPNPASFHILPRKPSTRIDPMPLIALVWLLGVCLVAIWHIGGWLWIRRLLRGRILDGGDLFWRLCDQLGITRAVRLIECAHLNVPAVVGVISPVILIPLGFLNDLPPDQLRAILAHELAHIRRHDYLINLLQAAVESLLFYHPATWWISAQIRKEREHCCDDIAASIAEPRMYASALLALEERVGPRGFARLAATDGSLLKRVQRLLTRGQQSEASPLRAIAAAVIVLAVACALIYLVWHHKKPASPQHAVTVVTAGAHFETSILADDCKPIVLNDRIESGDIVRVSISDLVGQGIETEKQFHVSDPDGDIDLPLLGKIKVAGLAEQDVARVIAKAYEHAQILSNARIIFSRVQSVQNTFSILGRDVDKPGQFEILKNDLRLIEAMAMAGAHPPDGETVVVIRKTEGGKTRTLNIPAKRLMEGDSGVDVVIHPGDLIVMHEAGITDVDKPAKLAADTGEYFIGGGGIPRSGVYSMTPGKITLKQAIIAAGGFNTGFVRLVRRDGGIESILLDNASCEDLIAGKQSDLLLHPYDTIMVNPQPMEWKGATTQQLLKQ